MAYPEADLLWCRQTFAMLAEGGTWAVPRSGLIFSKNKGRLELTLRMPWTPELEEAAASGADVPPDAAALHAYQDEDYEVIRSRFEAAGIPTRDLTKA